MNYRTESPDETYELGVKMGQEALPGQIYTLDGDLGAGKTVFAKGFAEGLGVTEIVNSPTFTILQTYESGRLPLYHFDVYRIAEPEEMDEIGYEDCFYGNGVTLVEWAELIDELIPADAVRIRITRVKGEEGNARDIVVE
ncbi:MAG: tRNA (adenosine(37)-N6)-threonylcarbamoyltransferase complex ATPase subunit type 1 TsaE [Eubacterium sp.]|nr:tRNA (adenosine(37)-N6)-threonylcarbamoyltransferase complex ATPase subunit type 1 TsaE [Eubacterium sp.]